MFRFLILLCLLFSSCDHTSQKSPDSLRIAIASDPPTLDPRKLRDLSGVTFTHLFFEGLTRLDENGKPQLAIAKEMRISPDQKTYTFILRDSHWSNGDPVTAYDFETTWKNNLNPKTLSPNAYQFYSIKGAKEASEGKIPIDKVGIKATNASTLEIQLNQPLPYLESLLATYFFHPVHSEGYKINNGPFQLKEWKPLNEIIAVKNPFYWDKLNVSIPEINFLVLDDNTALRLFDKGEIDWIGSPLGTIPSDALNSLKNKSNFFIAPAAATFFIRLNVTKPPFNNLAVRQAFRNTLRRQELVEHVLQGNQSPAYSLVPSFLSKPLFNEENFSLDEKLSPITLMYAANDRNNKIAQSLQEQWRVNLGVNVELQSLEKKVVLDKLKNHDYQMALGSWYADLSDPISYLEVFKDKNNGTNDTGWEHPEYKKLLDESAMESDPNKRDKILKNAENILIIESPIIPIFHASYNYMNDPRVVGVIVSELGYLDFKNAKINP